MCVCICVCVCASFFCIGMCTMEKFHWIGYLKCLCKIMKNNFLSAFCLDYFPLSSLLFILSYVIWI